MADIFYKDDVHQLLKGKRIYLFGDSNMRAVYKDLLWLLNVGTIIEEKPLRSKLEECYMSDSLIKKSKLNNGRDFVEDRSYNKNDIFIEFHFVTKCWSSQIENLLNDFKTGRVQIPDIVLFNSCLWDISRWGPQGITKYKDNMICLMKALKSSLPSTSLVIWNTTMPIAARCRGAFLVEQVDFLSQSLHFDVMEANVFAKDIVVSYGFDILDFHHYLLLMTHFHTKDGVHWNPVVVRFITNLTLTHIAQSWNSQLPGTLCKNILDKQVNPEAIIKVPNHSNPIKPGTPKRNRRKRNNQYRVRPYTTKSPYDDFRGKNMRRRF